MYEDSQKGNIETSDSKAAEFHRIGGVTHGGALDVLGMEGLPTDIFLDGRPVIECW